MSISSAVTQFFTLIGKFAFFILIIFTFYVKCGILNFVNILVSRRFAPIIQIKTKGEKNG